MVNLVTISITFIIILFIAVILMITFDMTDHTIAALIGASIAIIYFCSDLVPMARIPNPNIYRLSKWVSNRESRI